MSSDHEVLRAVSILRELEPAELEALNAIFSLREFKAKERIIEEGTPVRQFSIVLQGAIHVKRRSQKREMMMGRMGPGAFFGEINLFDPGEATASVYAVSPSTVAQVSYEDFRQFMSQHPATGYKIVAAMMKEMSRRLRQTSSRLAQAASWATETAGQD